MGYLIKMKPECSEEEVENVEFLTRPLACSFWGHSGFEEDQSMGAVHDVWHSREQRSLFFSRNKSHSSAIIKRKKGYLNSKVVENLSCVF